jgi:kynurenine formamidase
MKRVVDLTMHIYEGMGIGRVFPQEQEFIIEDVFTYEQHGIRLCRFTMWQEPGTRLNLGSLSAKRRDQPKLDEIELNDLYEKDTVILDIPKGPEEAVSAEEVEAAFDKSDYKAGDWVLVHTGWGDNQRYFDLGDDYALKSPYYSAGAAKKLAEIMSANESKLFGYDTCSAGHPAKHIIPEWCERKPRPKGWPSEEAKEFVRNYTPDKLMEDWGGVMPLPQAGIMILGGLVNLGALTQGRVKLIIFPMKIKGVGGGPCRVAAIED